MHSKSPRNPAPGGRRSVFRGRRGRGVWASRLSPKGEARQYPAVICIPGHGRGVDDIVGIDEHGKDRTTKVGYAYDYSIQGVENAMGALGLEPMAFGCR